MVRYAFGAGGIVLVHVYTFSSIVRRLKHTGRSGRRKASRGSALLVDL